MESNVSRSRRKSSIFCRKPLFRATAALYLCIAFSNRFSSIFT